MSKCPNGHITPPEFQQGMQIRCPVIKDGINCDAVYTVGAPEPKTAAAQSNAPNRPAVTRRIG